MMMRHIASVGETYAHTALEDAAWSLWSMNPSQATTSSSSTVPPPTVGRYPAGTGGLLIRTPTRPVNDNMANLLAMANTVHEVLPHIPDELILEENRASKQMLQQTTTTLPWRTAANRRDGLRDKAWIYGGKCSRSLATRRQIRNQQRRRRCQRHRD
ncbi:E3 ubiquitin protein ligase RIN2 [Linum perenne]